MERAADGKLDSTSARRLDCFAERVDLTRIARAGDLSRAVVVDRPDLGKARAGRFHDLGGQFHPVFARRAEPLPGLHRIAGLHGHIAEVHVGTLYPAAVRAGVLHRDGVSADGDDLAAALRGQRRVVLAADVYPLVERDILI